MCPMVCPTFLQLEYHLEHADEAIKHLQSAVTTLRITHGDDHPLVSVLAMACIEQSKRWVMPRVEAANVSLFVCRSMHQVSTGFGLLNEAEREMRRVGRMS